MAGLTKSETAEFHELSSCPTLRSDEFEARARDARWIELYLKHEVARVGMARNHPCQ
jgi:hypothetical protein